MKHALLLSGLVAALLGIGNMGQAVACGKGAQQGCSTVPSPRYTMLLRETDDFGYWMTYARHLSSIPVSRRVSRDLIAANIQKHLGGSLNTGVAATSVSHLLARMHLSHFPAHDTVTILRYTPQRAIERVHWQPLHGRGPLVRLTWTYSVIGWSITDATYLGAQ